MSLEIAIEAACKYLPEGYEVGLCMENGAAWIELHDPEGNKLEIADSADKNLDEQVIDAVTAAVDYSNQGEF